MGNRIQKVAGPAESQGELARFLADFVRSGALPKPRPGDDDEAVWAMRFRWWWDQNPFCREDSPRGYILRSAEGKIVGFNGLIPFDYEVDGEIVPSLVTTTFFVEPDHRDAVMGLVSKQRALGRSYHVVDGSPSPEMCRLLGRLGYENSGYRYQYFFPLQSLGGGLTRSLLTSFGLCFSLPLPKEDAGEYLALSPEEVETIPALRDGTLRRRVTFESLAWLSRVGTEKRSFFGLCDSRGTLIAYAIGLYKRRCGIEACLLLDYVDFAPEENGLLRLLQRVVAGSEGALPPGTDIVSWSVLGDSQRPARGLRRESLLYYHLPGDRADCTRSCVPFEGDLPLL